MIRVKKILEINSYEVSCLFNNGLVKKINLLPIIEKQNHLNGIEKLKDEAYFKTVKIGIFGEIFWENTIKSDNEFWNYDLSPEFIFHNGEVV